MLRSMSVAIRRLLDINRLTKLANLVGISLDSMLPVPPKSKYAIIITNPVAVINQSVTTPSHPISTLPIDILAKVLVKNKKNCMDPQLILRHRKRLLGY